MPKLGAPHRPTLLYALIALVALLGLYHLAHKH